MTEERLREYLRSRLPEVADLQVSGLYKMAEGYSYETYCFEVTGNRGGESFSSSWVVRMEPEHGPVPPYDVSRQFLALKALQSSPVPVPRVHWLEPDPRVLGRPFFLMDRVEGEVPLPWKTGRPSAYDDPQQRVLMAADFVRVLAAVHTVDWRALGLAPLGVPEDERHFAHRELERWRGVLRDNQLLPQPLLWEAWRWLQGRLPAGRYTTLVHGDFRLGNFIWRDGTIAAFLDWEMVAIGDPMSDLGWVCMKRVAGRSPLLTGLIDQQEFFRRYQELTGYQVDRESVFWWQVMGYFKLGTIWLAGVRAGALGIKRDMRLAAWEFDLPLLLDELAQLLEF